IRCSHPFIGDDIAKDTIGSKELDTTLDEIAVKISCTRIDLKVGFKVLFILTQRFLTDIRRVADDGIEAASSENFGEGLLPVEWIDAADFLLIGQKLAMEVIPADQRIAAADVMAKIGEDALET